MRGAAAAMHASIPGSKVSSLCQDGQKVPGSVQKTTSLGLSSMSYQRLTNEKQDFIAKSDSCVEFISFYVNIWSVIGAYSPLGLGERVEKIMNIRFQC